MGKKTIIIWYGPVTEAFDSLRAFCRIKKQSYDTWSRKEFPTVFQDYSLEKAENDMIPFEAVEVMGQVIRVQE